jgi:type I restriction enzyme, S subunit
MRDGWLETPIGDVAQVLSGFAFKSELFNKSEGIPLIRIRDLPKRDSTEALYSGSYEDRYVVKKGDFLIGMDGEFHCYEWNGPDALLNQRVCRIQDFKIGRVVPRYIYFAVNQYLDKIEQDTGYTTVKHISAKQVLGITIPLPPLPEQKRIVDLISSVDSYIEALQRRLESAKRSRNAVLHELLTAGGEDWVETNLAEVAVLNPSEPALSNTDHFAPMDAVHVGKRWVQYTEERRDRNGARARAGDVLFARITPCLENGKVAQVQSELQRCGGSTEFIVVRGTEKCTSDFLYFWCTLKENRDKAAELMTGTTGRQRLSWQDLGSLQLWLPSIKEQEQIVSIISEFDSLIDSTENAISQAQNLRSALLSDLLSGEHEIPASYDKAMGAA